MGLSFFGVKDRIITIYEGSVRNRYIKGVVEAWGSFKRLVEPRRDAIAVLKYININGLYLSVLQPCTR